MRVRSQFVWAIVALWSTCPLAEAFSFTTGTPTSCDDLTLSWTGGTAPFTLTLVPIFGTPRNISIPDSAYSGGEGSYSTTLPFSASQKFVATMSDATAFGSGGTTELLVTGSSLGGSCNTTDPGIAFPFELDSALQQCRPYIFSDYSGAHQPITITGFIPGGDLFFLYPPSGSSTFDWTANVLNGTSIIFVMVDSQGRQGGSSDVKIVGISDDSTCLSGTSPSSTMTPTPTSTSTTSSASSSTSAAPAATSTAASTTSRAVIAGAVVGGLIFVAVLVTLGLFFLRKRFKSSWKTGNFNRRQSGRMESELDLAYDPDHASNYPIRTAGAGSSGHSGGSSPFLGSGQFTPTPYILPPAQPSHYQSSTPSSPSPYGVERSNTQNFSVSASSSDPYSAYIQNEPPVASTSYRDRRVTMLSDPGSELIPGLGPPSVSSTVLRGKAAMAGETSYRPSRYVLHTDVEDDIQPNEDGVIELPPQYSERRTPIRGLSQHGAPSAPADSKAPPPPLPPTLP